MILLPRDIKLQREGGCSKCCYEVTQERPDLDGSLHSERQEQIADVYALLKAMRGAAVVEDREASLNPIKRRWREPNRSQKPVLLVELDGGAGCTLVA